MEGNWQLAPECLAVQGLKKQSQTLPEVTQEDKLWSSKLPVSQLRRMRAALSAQAELIAEAQSLADSLQASVDAKRYTRSLDFVPLEGI